MTARALVLLPLVLGLSSLPGLIALRRVRWAPLEKIVAAIGLSLLVTAVATFGIYVVGGPRWSYYALVAVLAAFAAAAVPDARRLLRGRRARTTVLAFAGLAVWTIGLQGLI